MEWIPTSGIIRAPKEETSNNYTKGLDCTWIINPHIHGFNGMRVIIKNIFHLDGDDFLFVIYIVSW